MEGTDHGNLVPVLIKAVQELKAENDQLRSRVEALEGGKGVHTTNVMRADSGVRTNQVCDVNGANCIAQGALGGSGGGVTAAANATCSVAATGNATCSATCPSGYFAASGAVVVNSEKSPCVGSTSATANGDCWFSSDSAVSIQNPGWGAMARTLHVRCLK